MSDLDLTNLEAFYEAVDDTTLEDATAPRLGLRVPTAGVTVRTVTKKTKNGTVTATVTSWDELTTLDGFKMGATRDDDPMRAYGALWMNIRPVVSRNGATPSINRGLHPQGLLLRFFPGLIGMTDEEFSAAKASNAEGHPFKYLKARSIENQTAHRLLGQLLIATGNSDRLTKGYGLRLPAVADLLANGAAALKGVEFVTQIRVGLPGWDGVVPDHEIYGFKAIKG